MKKDFIKLIKNSVNYWYVHLLTGIVFIGVGLYALSVPAETYLALSIIFALTFLLSGISEMFYAIGNRKEIDHWGWTLIWGGVTTLFGVMLVRNPTISLATLPFYVGFVLLFRSSAAIALSMDLKSHGVSAWRILMSIGVIGIIFSFIMIWDPALGGLSLAIWTGLAFIAGGTFSILLSLKLKKLKEMHGKVPADLRKKYEALQDEIAKAVDG